MKQKILNIINEYCQTRKSLGKFPYVISRNTLSIELKNHGIKFSESESILRELEKEGNLFSFIAVNDIVYYTKGYGINQ